MHLMHSIFKEHLDTFAIIFLDDVAARWGAAGFRSRWGRLALQHSLGCGMCCLHLGWWAESGRSFLLSRGGPNARWGSAPERAVCGGWRRSRMEVGWLAERPDSGAKIDSQSGARVQVKCARVRPDRGSLTSHQDKTAYQVFRPCPPSTVHLQSTLVIL